MPAACAGATAVIDVGLTTTTPVAGVPPMVTVGMPTNPVPVIVTAVPPAVGDVAGAIFVMPGAAPR